MASGEVHDQDDRRVELTGGHDVSVSEGTEHGYVGYSPGAHVDAPQPASPDDRSKQYHRPDQHAPTDHSAERS